MAEAKNELIFERSRKKYFSSHDDVICLDFEAATLVAAGTLLTSRLEAKTTKATTHFEFVVNSERTPPPQATYYYHPLSLSTMRGEYCHCRWFALLFGGGLRWRRLRLRFAAEAGQRGIWRFEEFELE